MAELDHITIDGVEYDIKDAGAYRKPNGGIPKTDLAGGVQSSLDKAEAAAPQSTTYTKTQVDEKVGAINAKIPAQASSSNQLADKDFVNSSIATSTATYRGSYNLISDLHLTTSATQSQVANALNTAVATKDKNDYVYVQVPNSQSTPTEIARIDRYKYSQTTFEFEYSVNNSGFTAAQWAAINSGITSGKITEIDAEIANRYTKIQTNTAIAKVGVYDISANNLVNGSPSTYASLADALGIDGANIPQINRVGGLTVRYIDSATSRYVQYFLNYSSFSTNTSNWQRIPNLVHISEDDYDNLSTAVKMNGDWYFIEEE